MLSKSSTLPKIDRPLARRLREVRRSAVNWAKVSGVILRPYQVEIVEAISDSVIYDKGLTFVVVLPRQSGKNELQAHLFAWLMLRAKDRGGKIVSVSPTFKPQVINSMDRVRTSLDRNIISRGNWKSSAGFIFRMFASRLMFFSADPSSKVVGATADLLLSVDEAQDVEIAKFDKDFDPMTASTNATRVFWGTVWTSDTLLHRQMMIAKEEQERDGIKRLFYYTGEDVRKVLPAYGEKIDQVVALRGRDHPLVKTQYFCETIDAQVGMFNAARRALMQGDQPSQDSPLPGHVYALTIDVGGQDEALINLDGMGNPGRDSVALDIIDIDLSSLSTLGRPIYRVVKRWEWIGESHVAIFGRLCSMMDVWRARWIVIDSTGVGEGLWSMLANRYRDRVISVKFSQSVKSELGYGFLNVVETGRFRDCAPNDTVDSQYSHCQSEVLIGPSLTKKWGVKDGTRDRSTGRLVHDDFIIADSMVAELDKLGWGLSGETTIIPVPDVLKEMDHAY